MFVVALFLLLGGFGTGGDLPEKLFGAGYWTFGLAAYLLALAFVYWGIYKFTDEEHQIPLAKLLGMLSILIFSAGFLFSAFAERNAANEWIHGHGGQVGSLLGAAMLSMLDKIPASIVFIVFTVMSVFFAFGICFSVSRLRYQG